jgi:hypothetical protein
MKNKPNPELIDDENPEWTKAMFSEAKTAVEIFPHLIDCNNEAVESFKRSWQEMLRGEYHPIATLWDDIDF